MKIDCLYLIKTNMGFGQVSYARSVFKITGEENTYLLFKGFHKIQLINPPDVNVENITKIDDPVALEYFILEHNDCLSEAWHSEDSKKFKHNLLDGIINVDESISDIFPVVKLG